jgi:NADPH-dependent 2,4-dienoyl-CoA reductase/sulfur reductase-like enzyme
MELPETIEFCKMIEGKVDLFHVTAGIYHAHVETKAFSSLFEPHGCNLDLAAGIKQAVKVPVAAVGGFNAPEQIEEAIASGKCDFAALGRQQFADPDFVNKTLTGHADEIAPCLRCSCFNPLPPNPGERWVALPWHCAVNPRANRELRWRQAPTPTGRRKVLVIGGGAGGMYAAITAADRGHDVTLAEKNERLGGVLWFTDTDLHKESLRRYRDSLIARCKNNGVKIKLHTEVDHTFVQSMNPDAVICAVGGDPAVPPIPGIEYAHHALFVYEHPERLNKKIVMIGGGLIGCETGLHLAESGHDVHILEALDDIAKEGGDSHRRALIPRMRKRMKWTCKVKITDITKTSVRYTEDAGHEHNLDAETILFATGLKARSALVDSLRDSCPWFVSVGDCVRSRQVKQAVYEGFCAAMDIL